MELEALDALLRVDGQAAPAALARAQRRVDAWQAGGPAPEDNRDPSRRAGPQQPARVGCSHLESAGGARPKIYHGVWLCWAARVFAMCLVVQQLRGFHAGLWRHTLLPVEAQEQHAR